MPVHSFYVVLGISPWADQDALRSAYRALAKRYHPDYAGPAGASRFQEVSEAYAVLSDPTLRRRHDRDLEAAGRMVSVPPTAEPMKPAPEPLTAEPLSLLRGLREERPSLEDAFMDWTSRHHASRHLPKSGRHQLVHLDVVLTPEEARYGGVVPIEVPGLVVCSGCQGSGGDAFAFCARCRGEGVVEGESTVRLRIPPLGGDETWMISSGGSDLDLRIRIRVDRFT